MSRSWLALQQQVQQATDETGWVGLTLRSRVVGMATFEGYEDAKTALMSHSTKPSGWHCNCLKRRPEIIEEVVSLYEAEWLAWQHRGRGAPNLVSSWSHSTKPSGWHCNLPDGEDDGWTVEESHSTKPSGWHCNARSRIGELHLVPVSLYEAEWLALQRRPPSSSPKA